MRKKESSPLLSAFFLGDLCVPLSTECQKDAPAVNCQQHGSLPEASSLIPVYPSNPWFNSLIVAT